MFPGTLISATIQGTFRQRRAWKDEGSVTGVDGPLDAITRGRKLPQQTQAPETVTCARRASRRRLLDLDLGKA
ncbi:hypothetical protein ABH924_002213 [Arthrobacter sp. GAS37]